MIQKRHSKIIFGGALLFVLLFSLTFFLIFGNELIERTFFFPEENGAGLTGEKRKIPRQKSLEESLESFLRDLILGPAELHHERILPKDTQVQTLIVHDGVAYIDFSFHLAFHSGEVPLSFRGIEEGIRRNIDFNFPQIKEIVLTVEGELPYQQKPPLNDEEKKKSR